MKTLLKANDTNWQRDVAQEMEKAYKEAEITTIGFLCIDKKMLVKYLPMKDVHKFIKYLEEETKAFESAGVDVGRPNKGIHIL